MQVQRSEQRADDGPVQLLPDQRQIDELMERHLQLVANRLALVRLVEHR
jgi:hypothetical protein